MKKVLTFFLLFCSMFRLEAQSNQVQVYLQQIAANKVLIGYIQKGYKIARTGLTTIGNARNGEFNLHRNFISSLKAINPKIKNSATVIDIIASQIKIIESYKNYYKRYKESGQFTDQELEYIFAVFAKLLDNTAATLEELFTLLTANKYQMSDDERIKRLGKLFTDMQNGYVFVQHFGKETYILAMQRMKEKQDIETGRTLYSLTNP